VQDAAAWLALAVALVLAPWARPWEAIGIAPPDPPGPFVAAGVLLALVAAAHVRGRGRAGVVAALAGDLVAAAGVTAWLVVDDPATATLGTVVLAVVAVGLALQAVFDAVILTQAEG
jgi:hypothetical protein